MCPPTITENASISGRILGGSMTLTICGLARVSALALAGLFLLDLDTACSQRPDEPDPESAGARFYAVPANQTSTGWSIRFDEPPATPSWFTQVPTVEPFASYQSSCESVVPASFDNVYGAAQPTIPMPQPRLAPSATFGDTWQPLTAVSNDAAPQFGSQFLPASGETFVTSPSGEWVTTPAPTRCNRGIFASCGRVGRRISRDYKNYYSCRTLGKLSIAVALAAPLANTNLDGDFQHWYQRECVTRDTDNFAEFWKVLGEGELVVPVYVGCWVLGEVLHDTPLFCIAGEWGERVSRGYIVGAPPMLLMQYTLGAGRPGEYSVGSQWRPFVDTNAVSGHAFMGAVPFITAAKMSDNFWVKATFYTCSTFTAWSRVNDDCHYLSQIALGWWMAYLACEAVTETDIQLGRCRGCRVEVMPIAARDMMGVGVTVTR